MTHNSGDAAKDVVRTPQYGAVGDAYVKSAGLRDRD